MRLAILLYGYFYIDKDMTLSRASHSKNQLHNYYFVTDALPHFITHVYEPLKKKYEVIDIYMITHDFDHPNFLEIKNKLIKSCSNFNFYFTNKIESPFFPVTFFNLLRFATKDKTYDRYFITRGDLFYKYKINLWEPPYGEEDFCWFAFKDHKNTWIQNKVICDILWFIDNKNNGINIFIESIREYILKFKNITHLHDIYLILQKNFGKNISHIINGYFDSNTGKDIIESCNPLYIMFNRNYNFDENNILIKDKTLSQHIFTLKLKNKVRDNFMKNSEKLEIIKKHLSFYTHEEIIQENTNKKQIKKIITQKKIMPIKKSQIKYTKKNINLSLNKNTGSIIKITTLLKK